jgi:putative transposase
MPFLPRFPMARLPRLAVPDLPHYLVLRGHNQQAIVLDDEDRRSFLAALGESAATQKLRLLAYALLDDQVHLLGIPPQAEAMGRMLQSLGRRYGAGFNRRHGRSGTLWEGRYRATVIDPAQHLLDAMRCVEQAPVRAGLVAEAGDWAWSSAAYHLGRARLAGLSDPPAYWSLGNTPFERELAWQRLLDEPLSPGLLTPLLQAVHKGWAFGSGTFIAALGSAVDRPLQPRPRGRPRRAPTQGAEG